MARYFFTVLTVMLFPYITFAQLTVSTDNATAYYEAGENMNFVVNSSSSGEVEYAIIYHKYAPAIISGVITVSADEPAYIPFTSADPALVICEVTKGSKSDEVAAAFSPYELDAFEEEPADFDQFWNDQKALLAAVPMDPQIEFYEDTDYTTTYKLTLGNIEGWKVYGYISIPVGPGPFPAILTLPPHGDGSNIVSPGDNIAERGGAISVTINIHNVEPDESAPDAYNDIDYTTKEGIYYRHGILGVVRAIDYIFSRDDFDGENVGVVGVSQGGGLATIVAGLDERVNLLVQSNGTMGQHSGLHYDRASGFPYYLRKAMTDGADIEATINATRYYDAIFFAKRYDGPSLSLISYMDVICPPATGFAFYDQFRGPKILLHLLELGHTHPEEYWNGRYNFFRRHYPSMLTPPWPWPDSEIGYAADAGPDLTVSSACEVNLTGQLFLENESIDSWPVQWKQIEGPGTASFADANAYNTSVSFSTEGTYVLRFSGDDLSNLADQERYYTLADYVTITINGSGTTAPEVTLSSNPTTATTIDVQVVFNQSVSGLEMSDFTIINGTATGLTGSGTTYSLTVSPVNEGNVEITLPAMSAVDCSNIGNAVSNTLIVLYEQVSGTLEIQCPEDISLFAPNGSSGLTVNWEEPNASSTCPIGQLSLLQTSGLSNGSDFPIGLTLISYQATDDCGNVIDCSFEVSIEEEEELPDADCISESENPWKEYIKHIGFGMIDKESSKTTYSDFTDESTVVQRGASIPFNLTLRYTSSSRHDQYIKVWIDYNQDGVFDETSETAVSSFFPESNDAQIFTITEMITIPNTATNGTSRMRVSMKRDAYAGPCEVFEFGEVEDYTVNIAGEVDPELSYTCSEDLVFTTDPGATLVLVNWEEPTASTTCPLSAPSIIQISGPPNGSLLPVGVTELVYSFFDFCNNAELCTFYITVEEAIVELDVTCPSGINIISPSGMAIADWEEPTINSNCPNGTALLTQIEGPPSGSNFPTGVTTIVYTATDDCGNQSTCSFDIIIIPEPQEICESESEFPWNDWINRVSFNDINKTSSKSAYSDFTDVDTEVAPGATYTVELTTKFSYFNHDEYWKVWIDYNHDGIFDEVTEAAFTGFTLAEEDGTSTVTITGEIMIPTNAVPGEARMRVSKKRGSYPTPCENFEYGEVEDYTVNVVTSFANPMVINNSNANQIHEEKAAAEFVGNELRLHPNPVSHTLSIDLIAFMDKQLKLEVVDVSGNILLDKDFIVTDRFELLDCSDYSQGVYVVRLVCQSDDVLVRKFLKVGF